MIATRTSELLRHLRLGQFDGNDAAMLEHVNVHDFVKELTSSFPIVFQERRIGRKWEISVARSVRAELSSRQVARGILVSLVLRPTYVNCLMLSIEDDAVTGISQLSRLTVWAVTKPELGLALRTGHGHKLDKTPDGWEIKAMRRRTIKLSEPFLQERGWKFDHLKNWGSAGLP